MHAKFFCSIAIVLLSLHSFSASGQWNGQPPLPPACGADSIKFKTSSGPVGDAAPPITPEKATIYVDFQSGAIAPSPTARIGLDGSWVGAIHEGSFIRFSVDPGPRHLCNSFELGILNTPTNRTTLYNLDAEPGKFYFLVIRVFDLRDGGLQDFQMVSADEGKYHVSQDHLSLSKAK